MLYRVPDLPYEYAALEPHIDARTMEIHHAKHHAGYVVHLNALLKDRQKLAATPLEEILADISAVPEDIRQAVRNHGGGHANHSIFWETMSPHGGGDPEGTVADAMIERFRSIPHFREELTSAALNRFGSGWAWLAVDTDGELVVVSTPNQDSPLMLGLRPILGVDVWEHAYYLKYQSRRADYLRAWWNVVNWQKVGELYLHAQQLITHEE